MKLSRRALALMSHHVTGMGPPQLGEQVYYQRGADETGAPGIVDINDASLMHQFGAPAEDHSVGVSAVGNVATAVPGVVVPSSQPEEKKRRQPGTKLCPSCSNTIAAALAKCTKCGHVFREKKEKVKRSGKRGKKVCPTCQHENPSACSQCQNCKHIFRLKMIEKYRTKQPPSGQPSMVHVSQQMHAQQLHTQQMQAQRQQAGQPRPTSQQQTVTSQTTVGPGKAQQRRVSAQMPTQMPSQQHQQLHQQAVHHQGPAVSAHMTSTALGPGLSGTHMMNPQQLGQQQLSQQQLGQQHLAQHHLAQQGLQGHHIAPHMHPLAAPHPSMQHHVASRVQQQQQQHQQHPSMQHHLPTSLQAQGQPSLQTSSQLHTNQEF